MITNREMVKIKFNDLRKLIPSNLQDKFDENSFINLPITMNGKVIGIVTSFEDGMFWGEISLDFVINENSAQAIELNFKF